MFVHECIQKCQGMEQPILICESSTDPVTQFSFWFPDEFQQAEIELEHFD